MGDCWWVIHEESILEMLQACAAGADPDVVLMEHYANSEHPDQKET